jgi:hypothetical protein
MDDHEIAKLLSHPAARWRLAKGRFATEEMGMAVNSLQKQPARASGRPFEKGRSGNPAGRPRGARNKATLAAEALFDSEAEALSRKAVELALGGSEGALRLCLDRIIAPRRERPIQLAVPPIRSAADIAAAMGAIVKAAAEGTITPEDAFKLSQMVDTFVRAIDTSDFDRRLQILENADAAASANAVGWYRR